ncbi:sterol desaturase family protein [Microvirga lenta]|uniref:sterol desaturase family protein n=1 Tax=Microvirga lenta TaxID=2881337 RepID=UPI001CFE56C1|nr:sterol desaturase family protein [Microvirga lenta]MCB5174486.1 sterol desaturase family protein [Microvirga lenta]
MEYLPDLKRLLLLVVVFVPAERLLALRPGQKLFRRGWANDLLYYVANGPIIGLGISIVVLGTIVMAEWLVPESIREAVASQPYWVQTLEVILLADVGFYVAHFAFHKIPWLWRFHAVHHSIEELDWLAAHRVHPVDQIITKGVSLLPIFALGFSGVAIAIFGLIYGWHSILLHANVKIKFGPLRWLIASPEFHHWHHANHREAYDKNFAGQLSILDVVFRTAYMPKGRMPSRYGTDDPVPHHYLSQLIYPFVRRKPRKPSENMSPVISGNSLQPVKE